jgi:PAS domain S-box-containing protein
MGGAKLATATLLDGVGSDMHAGSTRQQLIGRLRFILLICAVIVSAFTVREVFDGTDALGARFVVRVVGIALAVFGIVALRKPWALRHAWPLAVGIVCLAYGLTALAGVVTPGHEYTITAVLFVGAALITATVMPWGLLPQSITVLVGTVVIGAAVFLKDGNLHVLGTDPGAAVVMAFTLSLVTARKFHRYRLAHRRELQERQRAEATVRRLNAQLEDRVQQRTAELAATNQQLAAEVIERRKAADALRVSQAQLADTVDHSTAIVSLKDVDGRYLLVNCEFERRFERARAGVVGCTDAELFPAGLAERLRARDDDVLRQTAPVSFEQELSGDDPPRTYVCVKFPLHGADGAVYGVGSMATDITAVKQLEEALRRHQDELAHVLRLHTIGEMAATLAHEINQPLCAITNYAQGGAHRLRAGALDPAALLQAFEQIALEGLRAGQILRGIRGLVQRDVEAETAVDVNALAGEALRVLEPQARQHGVTVRLEGGAGIPPVQANATQIEQVMVNLMLNGMQATAGADAARREVVVATTRSGESIEVAVSDTGVGIAPTVASRLFTPFVTTKPRGLGLGLAISRTIVENHGGRLWAMANAETGTTFRFSLPIAADRSSAPRAQSWHG